MKPRVPRTGSILAFLALALLVTAAPVDANRGHHDFDEGLRGGKDVPPQTLRQGFESHDDLADDAQPHRGAAKYSAWLVESSRFMGVPFRAFMPDRGEPPFVDLPVNVGIIKAANGDITLYDSGWKYLPYIFQWNTSCCWADLRDQMRAIGLDPGRVKRIIIGHGHWDHAGQLSSFPHAVLYVQREELKQIDFFIDYPARFNNGNIRAVNTVHPITGARVGPPAQACARSPVCGYPPQTINEILGKLLDGKVRVVDGRHEVASGLIIHPAFRGHTYGSQLLQVNTDIGQLVFGSDTYSSWEGIRDWNVANIQQTDTIQQFLAYEKCYALTSRSGGRSYHNCIAAHEPKSYSDAYPITSNWWLIPGGNCSRAAELVLSNRERTRVPSPPPRGACTSVTPALPANPAP